MKSSAFTPLALALALSPVLAGCGKKPAPVAVTPAAPAQDVRAAPAPTPAPAPDPGAAARAEAERRRGALEARVFFDYDQDGIREDAKRVLDEKVAVLRALPDVRIRIEGNADERGSTEYNLALGSRRASTVAGYLTGYGVRASQLETVSFGEERPLQAGHDEGAWSQNRRADFVVVGGLGQ